MMKKIGSWIVWVVFSLVLVINLQQSLQSEDKTFFLPGQTSSGHYQIELKCEACHGESFSDGETMQKNCVGCHGEELKAIKDSHPQSKFTDPRNANRVKVLDARYCVTCHVEHQPEITLTMGVTRADGFCIKCHLEVAEDRPSHEGMAFTSCATAGCHNYHDNRALYEDFLLLHANEPSLKQPPEMPAVDVGRLFSERHPQLPQLSVEDEDAPASVGADDKIVHDWAGSSHAAAGVNCSACHNDGKSAAWLEQPGYEQCLDCHVAEVNGFLEGKHGMRLKAGLPPMKPKLARLQMNSAKAEMPLDCVSCHRDHEFELNKAAVDACSGCHHDEHSRNYQQSAHFQLWSQTQRGQLAASQGVSCATCHMPAVAQQVDDENVVATLHNQNSTLRPNEKMIRSVCLNCHSLAFSIDALADEALIKRNFVGKPLLHNKSIEMVTARVK